MCSCVRDVLEWEVCREAQSALVYIDTRTMEDVVSRLEEGWFSFNAMIANTLDFRRIRG